MNRRTEKCSHNENQCAFSLIELILVMTLLVIAISVVAPVLSGFFRGRTLDSEARRLLALTRAGESRAVSEGRPMLLWVDASQQTYGLEEETSSRAGDPRALEFAMNNDLKLEAVNASPIAVRGRKLPAIRFQPDGTVDESSPTTLRLISSDGGALQLVETSNHLGYAIQNFNR